MSSIFLTVQIGTVTVKIMLNSKANAMSILYSQLFIHCIY
ncbi:hypothetical protein SPHINGO8BC_50193 [Sphingobacterium multivorum]|uniref:Uncharacterized protein n=1 Tax=Sphingobacterium multivorum TaxID=28454 RepID=A0A654BM02_SPHMU|nr:hypothetical protein SPHINGO8BC_50193 [Sphingobacterium multivorum]